MWCRQAVVATVRRRFPPCHHDVAAPLWRYALHEAWVGAVGGPTQLPRWRRHPLPQGCRRLVEPGQAVWSLYPVRCTAIVPIRPPLAAGRRGPPTYRNHTCPKPLALRAQADGQTGGVAPPQAVV